MGRTKTGSPAPLEWEKSVLVATAGESVVRLPLNAACSSLPDGSRRTTPSVMTTAKTAATIVLSAVAMTNSHGLMLALRSARAALLGSAEPSGVLPHC